MERNFNNIYQEIYKNGIEELTKLKQEKYIYLFIFILLLVFLVILFFYGQTITVLMVILIGITFVDLFFAVKAELGYRKAFKELVIRKIVNLYNKDFVFFPECGVSKLEYREAFFDGHFDRFYSEDLIQGKILDNYTFKMSQVKTEVEKETTDKDGNTRTETYTLFSGLYGKIDIGDLMLMEMDITSNNFLNKYNKSRIEVDSNEFEKRYDLFSSDKVRTMEIFTSDIIEEFNKFKEETGYVMQIKVIPNRLYFRISCGDAFEAPVFKNALSYDYLYKNYRMIDFPVSIVTKILENALETKR